HGGRERAASANDRDGGELRRSRERRSRHDHGREWAEASARGGIAKDDTDGPYGDGERRHRLGALIIILLQQELHSEGLPGNACGRKYLCLACDVWPRN